MRVSKLEVLRLRWLVKRVRFIERNYTDDLVIENWKRYKFVKKEGQNYTEDE